MNPLISPAASVVILKPGNSGFDILLLKRSSELSFAPNYWVFAGGKLETFDFKDGYGEVDAAFHAAKRECLEETGLTVEGLSYLSTWTAPESAKRRFRTHFFVATMPVAQEVAVDGSEIVEHLWLPLSEAADKAMSGQLLMMPPTVVTLVHLSEQNDPSLLEQFLADRPYLDYATKLIRTEEGIWALLPGDSGWESKDLALNNRQHRLLLNQNNQYLYFRS